MTEDVYLKKVITLKHWRKTLRFEVSQDLFSSFRVDIGTRFLLNTLIESGSHPFRKVLDLGCGYGPVGLVLKSSAEYAAVHMVDRDALAGEFTRRNVILNGFSGVEVYGSLGYDDIAGSDFDLIVSNIPGKAGDSVITHFLRDACHFLKPGGLVAVVVVNAIVSLIEGILGSTPGIEVVFRQSRSGHTVFHYRFSGEAAEYQNAFDRGVYKRGESDFTFDKMKYHMNMARGLPEFDSLHYRTELLLEGLREFGQKGPANIAVYSPGQGHLPVVLWRTLQPESITLIDRDLLALRCSLANLILNGCPDVSISLLHRVGFTVDSGGKFDLVAGVLREEEGPAAIAQTIAGAAQNLDLDGMLSVSGSSTAAARLTDLIKLEKRLEVIEKRKRRGYCLLVMKPA